MKPASTRRRKEVRVLSSSTVPTNTNEIVAKERGTSIFANWLHFSNFHHAKVVACFELESKDTRANLRDLNHQTQIQDLGSCYLSQPSFNGVITCSGKNKCPHETAMHSEFSVHLCPTAFQLLSQSSVTSSTKPMVCPNFSELRISLRFNIRSRFA